MARNAREGVVFTPNRRGEERAVAYANLLGEHESIRAVRALVARIAESPVRQVLLYGETGTGKGLVARMLHRLSARASRPFVDVNCAAIPATLMESELFGHERGAFTGAQAAKQGLIEAAHGGTLFLDEIREMDLQLQAKLLTLLDTQAFRRVGAVKATTVDVRFVVSSNRILLSEVKAGRFRDDLYWRLQVVPVNIPPLRARGDDVLLLAEAFLRHHGARCGRVIGGLEPRVAEVFRRYSWPGNVRELENLIERIAILETEDRVLVKHLPDRILREVEGGGAPMREVGEGTALPLHRGFHAASEDYQRALIEAALKEAGGRQGRAAQRLRLSRHALRHQMLKLGMAEVVPG
jgi:transcriptional regulator with PAS, ATPase and Fis domain